MKSYLIDKYSALNIRLKFYYFKTKYNLTKPMTREDFYQICKAEEIHIIFRSGFEDKIKGRYTYYRNYHFLQFREDLGESQFLAVAAHELGHYADTSRIKARTTNFWGFIDITEARADYFASLMLHCTMGEIRLKGEGRNLAEFEFY